MAEVQEHEQILRWYVAEMVALGSDLEGALDQQRKKVQAHPEAAAVCGAFARCPAAIERLLRHTGRG
jgi:hypothetical protein